MWTWLLLTCPTTEMKSESWNNIKTFSCILKFPDLLASHCLQRAAEINTMLWCVAGGGEYSGGWGGVKRVSGVSEPSGSNEECWGGPLTFIKASGRATLSSAAGDNACSPAREERRWWITSKSRDKNVISTARIQTQEETGEYHTPMWKNHAKTKATSHVFYLSDLASESAAGVWT